MLLNLTNHPSEKWSEKQRNLAIDNYSTIVDMPFPHIPPAASASDVEKMVDEHFNEIKAFKNVSAVHIQGEYTFTFLIVQALLGKNIPCIVSTTERVVTEDMNGNKVSEFKFVRFREYKLLNT